MTRIVRLQTIFVAVVLCASAWWLWPDSLLRPETAIRQSVLRSTPLGSTSAEVRAFATRKGWLVARYAGNTGYVNDGGDVVGVTSVSGNLGDLGPMNVSAFWGFDSQDRLIDVRVWRTLDLP